MATLWAAHDLADHVAQTDHQAANKASSWAAMAGHVGTYQATQFGALLAVSRATGTPLSWQGMLAGGAFSAVSHAFLDRRWPVRRALELTGSPSFARSTVVDVSPRAVSDLGFVPLPLHGPYLADQALHHACLLVSALLIAGRR